ncbi:MAG: tRNA lysidine(34) synthetase TilS [Rhodospirillales bacterium]|nr:tRNA lysidine(34) synthetase TilS [Rhodospirillales bacterium]
MAQLGPFEPAPLLAVAVSGGAASLATALLAEAWARRRGGQVLGLIVDHGLRAEAAAEAALTHDRLAACGIAAQVLALQDLRHGPGLAERARAARYAALESACAAAGCLHLLTGHHRLDQAETVMIRALGHSGNAGLAGMPALATLGRVRLLRPLLGIAPARLRDLLRDAGLGWVEDPSNGNPAALRARLRGAARGAEADLAAAACRAGSARADLERAVAAELAERASLRPEGFALLSPGRLRPETLAALIQAVGGAEFPPASAPLLALAACPRPGTLAGVRLLPAGRLGPGWLLVREERAVAGPSPARAGLLWDGRFRISGTPPAGLQIGALGAMAARLPATGGLPSVVRRTMPGLWDGKFLVTVPHLLYRAAPISGAEAPSVCVSFEPRRPLAGAPFCPALLPPTG